MTASKDSRHHDLIKILVVVGTRPEAIKLAPVIWELRAHSDRFLVRLCATAQHREMLDQVLDLFEIVPDIDLDLMLPDQTLSGLAARVLKAVDSVLMTERPDWVLVQGDTTTVMAAALAAQHRKVFLGHIEAGLRTGDFRNPFPEEMNRVVTDHVSDLCFAPTDVARQRLLKEGIPPSRILVTGNTVIDSLLRIAEREWSPTSHSTLGRLNHDKLWILVTAHRRENFGQPLVDICKALRSLAKERDDICIVYPVHRNPNVWEPVHQVLADVPGIVLLPPIDYQEMVYLMKGCYLILSDSGGIQEEAPSLHKPVLILREATERPEAVERGASKLVGTNPDRIISETLHLLTNADSYQAMAQAGNPYGDGKAAARIVRALMTGLPTGSCL